MGGGQIEKQHARLIYLNSKHENSDIKIVHGKQDRHFPEEIDTTEHLRFDFSLIQTEDLHTNLQVS